MKKLFLWLTSAPQRGVSGNVVADFKFAKVTDHAPVFAKLKYKPGAESKELMAEVNADWKVTKTGNKDTGAGYELEATITETGVRKPRFAVVKVVTSSFEKATFESSFTTQPAPQPAEA